MFRFKKISKKAGLPPGTMVHVGEKKTEKVEIKVVDYNESKIDEKEISTVDESPHDKDTSTVTWININGLHQVDIIESIGKTFGLHPLVLEDIVNTEQRPKIEEFDDYIFIIMKMLSYDKKNDLIIFEQFSLVLGKNYIISFQEREGNIFNSIHDRIRNRVGRIRQRGPDYLAYALLDTIVDNYFIVLETIDEKIESIEEDLMTKPGAEALQLIHHFKKELTFIKKAIWPSREVISKLVSEELDLFDDRTIVFLRDVRDHVIQLNETIETLRDMATGLLDVYLSSVSNKMNDVMKILTIIATVFIPLTFIAGIYGMNFKYIPELEWKWGYPLILFVMFIIIVVMLIWFKRKRLM
ncbi:MAG: magnesium/cobalt transporter CorA [Desulfobacteraceae bacterium]|nr:magnesium/cobalt transporter CorA [Desulfobacteraceae bacterium]